MIAILMNEQQCEPDNDVVFETVFSCPLMLGSNVSPPEFRRTQLVQQRAVSKVAKIDRVSNLLCFAYTGGDMQTKLGAEFFGTFWLVLGGCGSAVLSAAFPDLGIGLLGVALAFGLTVVTMAYAVGHISGGHFNPAITIGLAVAGRHPRHEVIPYILAQVCGAVAASAVLYAIAHGQAGYMGGLAANGYGHLSPGKYTLVSGFVTEVVMTAFFLIVIVGATDNRAPKGMAPLAIGLCLTLIHLISIPVTNTSVNPARSTGPALMEMLTGGGAGALEQLWLFWVAPILGASIGVLVYEWLLSGQHPKAIPTAVA
jgi:aquaporin Z